MSHLQDNVNNFTIFSLNAQSINSKFNEFYSIISNISKTSLHFSVICFQETWLNENYDVSLQIPDYNLISKGSVLRSRRVNNLSIQRFHL